MKVTLGYKADEEYFAISEEGNRVEIDMLASEKKQAMSPMQLLLAGVIACAAVDIVSMVKKRRKTLIDFSGEITGDRRDELPKKFTAMTIEYVFISPDLREEEAEKLVKLAVDKYCSVAATIDPSVPIAHRVVIKRPA